MSVIENAGRLRYKESDRLSAIATELTKLGAKIIEKEDMLLIEGVPELTGGELSAHNDHRIAMALAVAAIYADGDVTLDRPDVVEKSYPGFWGDFGKVGMD
jgi:3-phosphoshikimate 1-carboxyvinyltransferase